MMTIRSRAHPSHGPILDIDGSRHQPASHDSIAELQARQPQSARAAQPTLRIPGCSARWPSDVLGPGQAERQEPRHYLDAEHIENNCPKTPTTNPEGHDFYILWGSR